MTRAVLFVAALAACHPWYRDGELAGRRAIDHRHAQALVGEAQSAAARGDHATAEHLLRQALLDVPDEPARVYEALAREHAARGDFVGARAVARRGLAVYPNESNLRELIVADRVADDRTADALDEAGATSVASAMTSASLAPHLELLSRALSSSRHDEAAAELAQFMAHYGVPDHPVLRAAREQVASMIANEPALVDVPAQADAEIAAGHVPRALALYSEAYQLLPESVMLQHLARFAHAAQQVTDPASIDEGAYELAIQGDRDAAAGLLGVAIHDYRKAVARAPWWADAHRTLANLLEADGRANDAAYERGWSDRLVAR